MRISKSRRITNDIDTGVAVAMGLKPGASSHWWMAMKITESRVRIGYREHFGQMFGRPIRQGRRPDGQGKAWFKSYGNVARRLTRQRFAKEFGAG